MPFRTPPPAPPPKPDPDQLALWWPVMRGKCSRSAWDTFTRSLRANHFPIPKQGA